MNFKKVIAIATAAVMLAAAEPIVSMLSDMLSPTAIAEGTETEYDENGLQIEDGVLVSASKDVTEVVIPNSVTKIGDYAFYSCSSLTSVTIPGSVTTIGYGAFKNCTSLTSVAIPDSVTKIGGWAFDECTSLTSITIPDSVVSIGRMAFYQCRSLTSVAIPDSVVSISEQVFGNCSSLTSIAIPSGVTEIGNGAFYGCSSLTSIDIPDSVTTIDDWTFSGCTNLTSVTIPSSVAEIGSYAFRYCGSLTSVAIPDSVTKIGDYAFWGCANLTSVTIPGSVTTIGDWAFKNCSNLTSMTIPASVTSIGSSAFSGTSLTSIIVEAGNEKYYSENGILFERLENGGVCLHRCLGDRESVTIPDGVTSIGDYAFEDCSSLTSVTIPDGVTSIGDYAFEDCSSLTSVTIPDGVTSIGNYAFWGCTSLTIIDIPDSVTTIGSYAFNIGGLTSAVYKGETYDYEHIDDLYYAINYGESGFHIVDGVLIKVSSKLTEAVIPDGVTEIGDDAFSGCSSLTSISIPASVTKISKSAFLFHGKSNLGNVCDGISIDVEVGNEKYYSEDGFLLEKLDDGGVSLLSYSGSKSGEVTIPDGVTKIGYIAFAGFTSLTNVVIPGSVTEIDEYAFHDCSGLTSITIPDGVVTIGDYAFSRCSSLTNVTIPGSVTTIGKEAFNISVLGGSINMIILDGVTEINDYAFEGAYLTSITIPNSVTKIGHGAFWFCPNLTSITIPASVTEIAEDAFHSYSSYSFLEEIIGVPGSYAETFAKENGYTFNAISTPVTDQSLTDETTDITVDGKFPEGTVLETEEKKTSDSRYDFEITLKDKKGNKVQPTGKATVKIPLPQTLKDAAKLFVYRLEGGKYIHYDCKIDKGYVVFETDHFSTYIVTSEELAGTSGTGNSDSTDNSEGLSGSDSDDDNPDTGIALAALPVVIAAGAAILAARKRRM